MEGVSLVIIAYLLAVLPLVGAVVGGRWAKSMCRDRRDAGRHLGYLALVVAFDVSFLAIWGAVVRPPGDVAIGWLFLLLLLQPLAFYVPLRVVDPGATGERPGDAPGTF